MKKKLYATQKNYLTCGILMIIVGIAMFYMPTTASWAWKCIGVGVLFVIGFLILLKRDGLMKVDESEEEKPMKKSTTSIAQAAGSVGKYNKEVDQLENKK